MRILVGALVGLFAFANPAWAGNYATCLLKHMPGLNNDAAAQAAINLCMGEFPNGMTNVSQGEGRGFLSYNSGAECALKKGGETHSQMAGRAILMACNRLYNEPQHPADQFKATPAGTPPPPPMSADQFLKNAPTPQVLPQVRQKQTGPTWSEQQERRRQGCVIKDVMTDDEINRCRSR